MMIHNLLKYLVQTRLRLWDIKITICYFYISQTKSNLDKIFYKVVYHHIIYMCDFFSEFRWLFCRGLYGFSRRLWFPPDTFPLRFIALWLTMSVRWMKKPTSFVDFLSVVKMLDGDTQIPCEFVLNALFLWCAFQVPIPSGWQSDWLQTRRICCCDQECDNKR